MDDPLKIDPGYRRAALRGMWSAGAFAIVLAALAGLIWMGAIGQRDDAPMVLLMAAGSAALFIVMRFFIRAATD
ncbi:MAG TPA: hypothetical protein VGC56_06930 [Allosphingosinicella sp.]